MKKLNSKLFCTLSLLFGVLLAAGVNSATKVEEGIIVRIKPFGEVCVTGEDCSATVTSASADAAASSRTGESVYSASCFLCHAAGIAGAPKTGDAAAWGARLEQDMATLVGHVVNGFNAMPPMGTCMDCSNDEIEITVQYMLDQVK